MKIILASASPRRKVLMEQMGLLFEVRASDADENNVFGTPAEVVSALAKRKAKAVLCGENELVVAADTVVAIDGLIMNKPQDEDDAKKMLSKLSGRQHDVFTGVCVKSCNGKCFSEVCRTKVYFRNLTEEDIDDYIKTGEPSDKAGAYGIQGRGALLVEKIDGDYYNVVGLPLVTLQGLLKKAAHKL